MMAWQDRYHLNIALGTLFLPLTLEAAVRLRRRPGPRPGVVLGLVLGASVLTNQESAALAVLLAAAILLPWLIQAVIRRRGAVRTGQPARRVALAAVIALVVASPQLIAMIVQAGQGGAALPRIAWPRPTASSASGCRPCSPPRPGWITGISGCPG